MVTEESQWYVQKGARVQGPFTATEVGRFLLLGRVRNSDRVSRDGELWEPVTQVPELIPEELLDLDNEQGWKRFLDARSSQDERQHRGTVEPERRDPKSDAASEVRDDWQQDDQAHISTMSFLPWSLLGITLAALGVVLYLNSTAGVAG